MAKQSKFQARHLARLAAVQALYQIQISGKSVESVVEEFISYRFVYETEELSLFGADSGFFKFLVQQGTERAADIDKIVEATMTKDDSYERVNLVLKCILRLGCLELINDIDPPTAVVINEYVEISKGFYNNLEVAFVNGSLDAIAKTVRSS